MRGVGEALAALIVLSISIVAFGLAFYMLYNYSTGGSTEQMLVEISASGSQGGGAAVIKIRVRNIGDGMLFLGTLVVSSPGITISWYSSTEPSITLTTNQNAISCSKPLTPGQYLEASIQVTGSGWVRGSSVLFTFIACTGKGTQISQSYRVVL